MRLAILLLAACASTPHKVTIQPIDEIAPPLATFRWSLTPLVCEDHKRSTVDTCSGLDAERDQHLVAVFAPQDSGDNKLAVLRYDSDHLGGPLRWQRLIGIGDAPHSAVIMVVHDAVIVAAISNGAARVVALDNASGRALGNATIVKTGAVGVQLENMHDFARIHVRTATGGAVAVMHPRTGRVLATRTVSQHALVEPIATELAPVHEGELDGITVAWEQRRLVIRRGNAWQAYLRAVYTESEMPRYRTTLQRAGEHVMVSVHETDASKVEVLAFDYASGSELWRSVVTSAGESQFLNVSVRTLIEGDQLLVRGDGQLESYVCTLSIADGTERACIDRQAPGLVTDGVIEFPDDAIVTP